MSQFTKKAIIETFMELLSKYSMDKITVKDIVECCGVNRNTFYYYYKDIYDLVDDIFDMELERVRNMEMKHESWYEEIRYMVMIIIENRAAINHVYQSKSRDVLERYIFNLSELVIKEYISKNQLNHLANEKDVNFVCDFYRASLAGMLLNWLKGDMKADSDELIKKVTVIIENTIGVALKCCAEI